MEMKRLLLLLLASCSARDCTLFMEGIGNFLLLPNGEEMDNAPVYQGYDVNTKTWKTNAYMVIWRSEKVWNFANGPDRLLSSSNRWGYIRTNQDLCTMNEHPLTRHSDNLVAGRSTLGNSRIGTACLPMPATFSGTKHRIGDAISLISCANKVLEQFPDATGAFRDPWNGEPKNTGCYAITEENPVLTSNQNTEGSYGCVFSLNALPGRYQGAREVALPSSVSLAACAETARLARDITAISWQKPSNCIGFKASSTLKLIPTANTFSATLWNHSGHCALIMEGIGNFLLLPITREVDNAPVYEGYDVKRDTWRTDVYMTMWRDKKIWNFPTTLGNMLNYHRWGYSRTTENPCQGDEIQLIRHIDNRYAGRLSTANGQIGTACLPMPATFSGTKHRIGDAISLISCANKVIKAIPSATGAFRDSWNGEPKNTGCYAITEENPVLTSNQNTEGSYGCVFSLNQLPGRYPGAHEISLGKGESLEACAEAARLAKKGIEAVTYRIPQICIGLKNIPYDKFTIDSFTITATIWNPDTTTTSTTTATTTSTTTTTATTTSTSTTTATTTSTTTTTATTTSTATCTSTTTATTTTTSTNKPAHSPAAHSTQYSCRMRE